MTRCNQHLPQWPSTTSAKGNLEQEAVYESAEYNAYNNNNNNSNSNYNNNIANNKQWATSNEQQSNVSSNSHNTGGSNKRATLIGSRREPTGRGVIAKRKEA